MSVLKKNIIANFGGSLWTGLMGLVFVPLYIHFMGIEAYGLVGIFATLLGIFSLLDMGLGATINREMARLSVQENNARDMRDMLRTLEIPYWGMACLIGITVIVLAPLIAYHWVNVKSLSPDSVRRAIIIMGIATAFQWPIGLYSGGMRGLQRQVLLNAIDALMSTCRGVGAVLILWIVSPTVEAFFTWQIAVSVIHTVVVAVSLWHSMPDAVGATCFRRQLLLNTWRFAAGIAGTNILTTILRQLDKVILTRMLSLEMFGYYSLATVVAMNMNRLTGPVVKAIYPQLVSLVALGSNNEIIKLYHKSAQLISVLILPATVVIALFSKEILLLWTRDTVTAEHTYLLVSILLIGTALNSLMFVPYALQLASGWTKLGFFMNFVSVLVLAPLIIFLTIMFGVVGAASAWGILNIGYIIFAIPIMHQRLLRTEKWSWYLEDIGLPFVVALFVAGAFRLAIPAPIHDLKLCFFLFIVSAVTLGATALSTPFTRVWVQSKISR
jgi:O-antigen/teichoic acid export membrane protein